MFSHFSLLLRKVSHSKNAEPQRFPTTTRLGHVPQGPGYRSQEQIYKTGRGSQAKFGQKSISASETRSGRFMRTTPQSPSDNAPCHVDKCPTLSYFSPSPLLPRAILPQGRIVVTGDYPGLACNERVFSNPKLNPVQSLRRMQEQRLEKPERSRRLQPQSLYRKSKAATAVLDQSFQEGHLSNIDLGAYPPIISYKNSKPCPGSQSTAAEHSTLRKWKRPSTINSDSRATPEKVRQRKQAQLLKVPVDQRKAPKTCSKAAGYQCNVVGDHRIKNSISPREQDGISVKVLHRLTKLEWDRRQRDCDKNDGRSTQFGGHASLPPHTPLMPDDGGGAWNEDRGLILSVNSSFETALRRVSRSAQPSEDSIDESLMHLGPIATNELTSNSNRAPSCQSDSGYSSYTATGNERDESRHHSEAEGISRHAPQATIDADIDAKSTSTGSFNQPTVADVGTTRPVNTASPANHSPIQSISSVVRAAAHHFQCNNLHTVEERRNDTTTNDNLSTPYGPSSYRVDEDVRNHPYRDHRLFNSHPHLRELYPPNIPAFVSQPVQVYPAHYTSEDREQPVSIGPNYVPVLHNTVFVTCESCLRRFIMTTDRLDVLDRHQRLFCRTARHQNLQKWWRKVETRLGLEVAVDHAEGNILSGSGATRNVGRLLR
ncbi:unnamed protein product [Mortierella alpina]